MDRGIYDLLIVTDATASMSHYLEALNDSLPDIIRISTLTGRFSRIGVVAYRDYCGGLVTEWSGWYAAGGDSTGTGTTILREHLINFVKGLAANYGGDWPEATKTGLALAHEHMRREAETIMLLYADAPPHTPATGGRNREKERTALTKKGSFGGHGRLFSDWISAAKALRDGEKRARVFSIIASNVADTLGPYLYLSTVTKGACLELDGGASATLISVVTVGLLLAWMGVEKEGSKTDATRVANVLQYINQDTIGQVKSEDDKLSETYMVRQDKPQVVSLVEDNLRKAEICADDLKRVVCARQPDMADFSKRYLADESYRRSVVSNLEDIIQSDVRAISVNPVFGSLWRTVCNDRLNEARDKLIEAFGAQIDKISDADRKADMKTWLEESYDYVAEITEIIRSVPDDERYPCVFLDPTLKFEPTRGEADEDDEKGVAQPKNPTEFTREELLEIGRSCDYRVLRRLGRVLTRLTYVATKDDLPRHVRDEPEEKVSRIPLALATPKHKRKFWKILLHTFLPGTMLSARPAALLAALSLRMGIVPLRDVADAELVQWQNNWNTLDIPETWNTSCLSLILDADGNYEARVKGGITTRPSPEAAFLLPEDRRLFKALVDYKMTEMNLDTDLTARVGWRPSKSRFSMGPTTKCKVCHYPRSVTIMGAGGVCGMCSKETCDCANSEEHEKKVRSNVRETDDEGTKMAWVECSVTNCRAQYVLYQTDKLNVRPKCHYCRSSKRAATDTDKPPTAPFVECTKCLSRVIWPAEYRPAGFVSDKFNCPACASGDVQTIIEAPTTAKALVGQNGVSWLLRNDGSKIAEPFNGRTLFHVISTAGRDLFADKVEIFPTATSGSADHPTAPRLTIGGKLIRNQTELLAELAGWISARRTQASACSLCFSTIPARRRHDLRPACGRSGCHQRICGGCREAWYGLNARGRIVNVAALSCPFCRRQPAAGSGRAVARFVGDLRLAVEEAGTWVYAWCADCGFAKRFVERVCAAGAPVEVTGWRCDECREAGTAAVAKSKNCPGCGVATEKSGGCDHMECPIEGCGTHWCFHCGTAVLQSDIYQHMTDTHGGWYAGQDEEMDVDSEDDEDDRGWIVP